MDIDTKKKGLLRTVVTALTPKKKAKDNLLLQEDNDSFSQPDFDDTGDNKSTNNAGPSTIDVKQKTKAEPGSGRSSTSDSQNSSKHGVEPNKVQELFIVSEVDSDTLNINFYINAVQRPDTLLDGQGDHITSYTLIIQALLGRANANLRSAIEAINSLATVMLKDNLESLSKYREIQNHPPETLTHEERKEIIEDLRKSNKYPQQKIEQADKNLKYAKISKLSTHLAQLSTCLLQQLQKQELTTVFSKGRLNKVEAEGSKAKAASRMLTALDQICYWCSKEDAYFTPEVVDRIIVGLSSTQRKSSDSEENHVLRYGISFFYGSITEAGTSDGGKMADGLKRKLEANKKNSQEVKKELLAIRDKLAAHVDLIADCIGSLYDYHQQLDFDLAAAFGNAPQPKEPIQGKGKKKAVKAEPDNHSYWENQLEQNFSPDVHNFNIEANDVGSVTRKKPEILIKTIQRHFAFIEAAFPHLKNKVDFSKVGDIFLQQTVLEAQGWNNHPIKPAKKGAKLPAQGKFSGMTIDYLKEKLYPDVKPNQSLAPPPQRQSARLVPGGENSKSS